jgi:NADPH-dependent ferric siderophore reductase
VKDASTASDDRNPMAILTDPPALAQRVGGALLELTVIAAAPLTAQMRRIRFGTADAQPISHQPGQDLMFAIVTDDRNPLWRRYTIRSTDPTTGIIDVEALAHGTGPGATWMTNAQPGDTIRAVGPRGNVTVNADAEWHLFIGDASFAPATAAMLEALPIDATVTAVLEVADADEQQPIDHATATIRWLHRNGAPPGQPDRLLGSLDDIRLPPGTGHVYVGAELSVAAAVRDRLLQTGLNESQISSKAYWRGDRANAAHGEPDRP